MRATELVVLVSVAIGLAIFFLPQVYLHNAIVKAKDSIKDDMLKGYSQKFGEVDPNVPSVELLVLFSFLDYIDRVREWPVDYALVVPEILIGMLPIVLTNFKF